MGEFPVAPALKVHEPVHLSAPLSLNSATAAVTWSSPNLVLFIYKMTVFFRVLSLRCGAVRARVWRGVLGLVADELTIVEHHAAPHEEGEKEGERGKTRMWTETRDDDETGTRGGDDLGQMKKVGWLAWRGEPVRHSGAFVCLARRFPLIASVTFGKHACSVDEPCMIGSPELKVPFLFPPLSQKTRLEGHCVCEICLTSDWLLCNSTSFLKLFSLLVYVAFLEIM